MGNFIKKEESTIQMISIIIPTYNEEKYLPRLLGCIKKQTYRDYEIIAADAHSEDDTRKIAKRLGCRLVNGGMHPGISRNNGAKVAKGEILLFLDADSMMDENFIKISLEEIESRKLDVAGSCLYPLSEKLIDKIFLGIFNAWVTATQLFYPNACGTGIFCRRELHKRINGFDETIKLSEDMDYVRRASGFGKFRIIRNSRIGYSMRRYDKEGRFKVGLKLFLSALYRIFLGEIRSDVFKYNLRYKK